MMFSVQADVERRNYEFDKVNHLMNPQCFKKFNGKRSGNYTASKNSFFF